MDLPFEIIISIKPINFIINNLIPFPIPKSDPTRPHHPQIHPNSKYIMVNNIFNLLQIPHKVLILRPIIIPISKRIQPQPSISFTRQLHHCIALPHGNIMHIGLCLPHILNVFCIKVKCKYIFDVGT